MTFDDFVVVSILVPITAGFYKIKPASKVEKSVLFFLLFAFLIDSSFQLKYSKETRMILITFYSLIECLFYTFIIQQYSSIKILNKTIKYFYLFFFLLWITAFVIFKNYEFIFGTIRSLYEMFYYMVLSFLSGIVLLNMIEKEEPYRKTGFWFVLAVFVNCFCAFFIASFIRDEMVQKVWFIYNITSLISVLIFTKAFLSIKFVKT